MTVFGQPIKKIKQAYDTARNACQLRQLNHRNMILSQKFIVINGGDECNMCMGDAIP